MIVIYCSITVKHTTLVITIVIMTILINLFGLKSFLCLELLWINVDEEVPLINTKIDGVVLEKIVL